MSGPAARQLSGEKQPILALENTQFVQQPVSISLLDIVVSAIAGAKRRGRPARPFERPPPDGFATIRADYRTKSVEFADEADWCDLGRVDMSDYAG